MSATAKGLTVVRGDGATNGLGERDDCDEKERQEDQVDQGEGAKLLHGNQS